MRNLLLLILTIFPYILYSQINQTDTNGLRQGPWQKKYPSGQLMYEGQFKDDKPYGDWIRYFEGGQVKAKLKYFPSSDSALAILFNLLGKKIAEGLYINEKRTGTWKFISDGILIAEENYVNGLKHGISRKFYSTGEIFEEAEWVNGKQEGKYQVYFKNGKPYIQCKFLNNKRNGLCLVNYENGRTEMEAYYDDNKRDGEWKFYDEQGEFLYTLKYDQGRLLNPEVRDSIDNLRMRQIERDRNTIPDPDKFIQNPTEYMNIIQKMP